MDESPITGEAYPVAKKNGDLVFGGCFVVGGRCEAIVKKTGLNSEMGKIAAQYSEIEEEDFFSAQLKDFSTKLLRVMLVIIGIFFLTSFVREGNFLEVFLAAVALAVAAIPEGLSVVSLLAMVVGVKKMAKENVLVKRLNSINTLGSVDIIVSDKTGTITKAELTLKEIVGDASKYGSFFSISGSKDPVENAIFSKFGRENRISYRGRDFQLNKEIPFDYGTLSSRRVFCNGDESLVFLKGAPESIFEKFPPCEGDFSQILKDAHEYMLKGYRVIGLAVVHSTPKNSNLVCVGLALFEDPVRKESKEIVAKLRQLGIAFVMATGDHKNTAKKVAEDIGLSLNFLSGEEFEKNPEGAWELLKEGGVLYRAKPQHKLELIRLFQRKGRIVAATGDGVNDALLLKSANFGFAMGSGTDIAKDAADAILLDNGIGTIYKGIVYGRGIIVNVRKFILFLLGSNIGEVVVNVLFPFVYPKIPLDAPKLLWINFITDGFPATAFAFDQNSVERMKPRDFLELLTSRMERVILSIGVVMGVLLFVFYVFLLKFSSFTVAASTIFATIVLSELGRFLLVRVYFKESIFKNGLLWAAIVFSLVLHFGALYMGIFHTQIPFFVWPFVGIYLVVSAIASILVPKLVH